MRRLVARLSALSAGRFVAVLAVLSLAPLALLAYFSVRLATDAATDEVKARVRATASVTSDLIDFEMRGLAGLVESYARRPHLVDALEGGDYDRDQVRRHLRELQLARQGIAIAFFADPNGRLIDIVPETPTIIGDDFSYRDWYKGVTATGGPYVSEAYKTAASGHALVAAAAAEVRPRLLNGGTGERLGILVAAYDFGTIESFVEGFARAEGVDITVTDQRGVVVASPGRPITELVSRRDEPGIRGALAGRSHVLERESGDVDVLAAYAPVRTIGWTVSAEVPASVALAGVEDLRSTVVAIATVLALVLIGGLLLHAFTLKERRRAEEVLQEKEEQTRAILEAAKDAFVGMDDRGFITNWNSQAEALFGWTRDEAIGRKLADTIVPVEDRRAHEEGLRHFLTTGEGPLLNKRVEIDALHKDGGLFPVELVIWPLMRGDKYFFNAFIQDITERRQAEALRSHLAAIVDGSEDAVLSKELDGTIVSWNNAAERLYGYSPDEIIGRNISTLAPPNKVHEIAELLGRIRHGEPVDHFETVRVRKDGSQVPVSLTMSPIKGPDGQVIAVSTIARDITERKQAEEALRESEATLQALFAASPDIITMVKADGQLEPSSRAVHDILGYDPDTYEQMDRMSLIHPDDRAQVEEVLRSVLQGGPPAETRFRVRHADGHWVVLESHNRAMTDAEGRPNGLVAVSRDVTEAAALEEALRTAKEEAEQATDEADRANRAKSEFLSRMSHELRTPLNAVLGFTQLLEMDDLSDEQRENLREIAKGGRHLLDLINEVLDLSRIETGRLALSLEPVAVVDVVEESKRLIAPLASERGIELVGGHGCEGLYVLGDRQRLKQVLLNILANAVKYNREAGRATVECETEEESVVVRVADTGRGITQENMARLFTPFDRLGAESSDVEGTGLGLSLARSLVEAMGGRLSVQSQVGEGTTVAVELPACNPPDIAAAAADADLQPVPVDSNGSHTVLCIEDNLANLKLIQRVFSGRSNVELLSSMQGSIGLDLAREHIPDLILLDLHLPDMSGQDVLERLKNDPRTEAIPTIVISADATQRQQDRLLAAGARAYLTKPIDVRILIETVESYLEGKDDGHHAT